MRKNDIDDYLQKSIFSRFKISIIGYCLEKKEV